MALSEERIYGYNSVRSDGMVFAWKADNSSIYTHFQVLGAPVLVLSDIKFLVKVVDTLEKDDWIPHRYSPGRCKQYYFPFV